MARSRQCPDLLAVIFVIAASAVRRRQNSLGAAFDPTAFDPPHPVNRAATFQRVIAHGVAAMGAQELQPKQLLLSRSCPANKNVEGDAYPCVLAALKQKSRGMKPVCDRPGELCSGTFNEQSSDG